MTRTQADWLKRLRMNPKKRIRYGAPGIPERTADALVKLGLIRTEWQRIFLSSERSNAQGMFCVLAEPETTDTKASP